MNNENTSIIKARRKRGVLVALVILCAVIGSVFEYQQATAPLDETTFFVVPQEVPLIDENDGQVLVSATPEIKEEKPVNQQALKEFFGYWDQVDAKVEELSHRDGSVLNHIHAAPLLPQEAQENKKVFQEGQIEIYDNEQGVIAVVDEKKSADAAPNHAVNDNTAQTDNDATEASEPKPESEVGEAQQKLQQQVSEDLLKAAHEGEEAPVVLIPGMGVPAPTDHLSEEEIVLTEQSDEPSDMVHDDMKVINKAMEEIDLIKIDDLSDMTKHLDESGEKASNLPNPAQLSDGDDGEGAVNMLQQIGQ